MHPNAHDAKGHDDKAQGKVMDPVCGMMVDPETSRFTLTLEGKTYYFCAPGCLSAFARDPAYYLEHGPQGMPGHHEGGHS